MPVPNIRNPIRPARGDKADLVANVADLYEGELVFASDEEAFYVKKNGSLTPVSYGHEGDLLLTNLQNAQAGDALLYNGTKWVNGGVQDGGNF